MLVFSINASSTGSGVNGFDHGHDQESCDVLIGNSGTDTHHTVNIPGVYDDCAHHGEVTGTCATTADGGIYDPGWLGSNDPHPPPPCPAVGNW